MKEIKSSIALLMLLAMVSTLAWGQAVSSASGTVTDPSGAVIPGAKITLESIDRGVKREATADQAGRYMFAQVQPGTYKLTGTASGFSDVVVSEVRLLVNMPTTVNIAFEKVGQVSETIAVSAEAIQVNTTDASIGNAIGTKPILQLPMNARNIVSLLALQPGVVFTSEGDTDSRNGAVNGGKSDQANVTLDGVDANDQMDRYAFNSALRVTLDSVQEFRVTTMNANADQGRSSGAQITMVTKSGTNDLHGALYEYHRNTITTANGFFNNLSGVERPKLIRNIFGASGGGAIIKNRLFIFGNYEGRRDAKDSTVVRAIPSVDMRQGIAHYRRKDGSIATVTSADMARIFDPRGASPAALKVLQAYPQPNDHTQGDDLNIQGFRFKSAMPLRWNTYISRIDYTLDSAAKHTVFIRGNLQNDHSNSVMPQFPGMAPNAIRLTNNKGLAVGLTSLLRPTLVSNFRYGITRQGWEDSGVANYNIVTLRGLDDPVGGGAPVNGTGGGRSFTAIIPVHTFAEDMSWTRGAHNIQFGAVARFSSNRRTDFQNSFSSASANASWLVDSGSDLVRPFADLSGSATYFKYALTDIMGLVTQGNAQYNYKVDGSVIGEGKAVLRNYAGKEYEMYVMDTWKVNRGLTLTAGLRWSLMPPIYEANGQQVSPNIPIGDWFNMRGGLAQQGKSQMEAGRISFIPKDQGGGDLYPFHKRDIAPRLALAYSPQGTDGLSKFFFGGPGKTSIRAGWGMYYDLFGSSLMRSYDAGGSYGLATSLTNPSALLTVNTAPRYVDVNTIPKEVLLPAPPATFPKVYPDAFAITRGLDSTLKAPYNMSANLSIGREFRNGWFVQGSYVGRFSRRSLVRRDAAMPTDLKDPKSGQTYFQAATILAEQVNRDVPVADVKPVPFWENMWSKAATGTRTATQVAYNRFYNNQYDWTTALYNLDYAGSCTGSSRCSNLGAWTMFHPQFSYLSVFSSIAGGNYHAMQWGLKKRFSNGDTVEMNYAFSKSMDLRSQTERAGYSSGVIWNPWQPRLSRGLSDYDNTHLFNMNAVYNLPFGRKGKYLTGVNGVANALVGGWQLAGLWRWSSGFPISVYETSYWPTNWNNNNWAQWTGAPIATKTGKNVMSISGQSGPNMFPNPQKALDAFDFVMPGGIGTRNPLRGDGVFNIDASLNKRFQMPWSERHSLQFRWEVFNVMNTTRFDVNSASLDIAVGGTFGVYSDALSVPRVMQFGLRYEF